MSTRPGMHQSNPVVAADFVTSVGFGTTRSHVVKAGSTEISGAIDITAGGTGLAANPTVVLTFKAPPFAQPPFCVTTRGNTSQPTIPFTVLMTTTTMTLVFRGTPVAADLLTVFWALFGGE